VLAALPLLALLSAPPDSLVVGILADPVSLDPHQATSLASAAIVTNVCEPLVRQRADGRHTEPVLAATWATEDNRIWTFTLREGIRFQDGTPFDADAVVANVDWLRRERGFAGAAERLGPHVVSITLERPNAALLATLSQPFFSLQSPRRLGPKSGGEPVGTGPFRLRSRRAGRVEIERNPDYWGGPPWLSRIIFRRFRNQDALFDALLEGQVCVTSALGSDHVERLRNRVEFRVVSQVGLNIAFLSINNERAPFDDVRVRQAIARSVDRPGLVAEILGGQGEPARNPLPPGLGGYAALTKELILDRAQARRWLADAGVPEGFDTILIAPETPRPYMPAPIALARRIAADLETVGIRCQVVGVPDWAEYLERATRGDYELAVLGWQADTTDPNDFLSALLASASIGRTNRSRYRSVAMDSLLKRGRMVGQLAERWTTYREAQELFQRDMPWVPLYHVSAFTAESCHVRDLRVSPTGTPTYQKVWKAQ
jgi:peptide/nickel transport system substrate-binding protein